MTSGPESEPHHEPAEPERIPISDPGKAYIILRREGNDWITTHQGPNGNFYIIKNATRIDADKSLSNEKARNDKLKDPVANGLYRLNKTNKAFRPAPSDKEHPFIAASPGTTDREYGVGNSDLMNPDTFNKIGSRKFISAGRGPSGSNEKAAIGDRSASIVLSYEARDKAIAEGKSVEEAQEIGARIYREQEGLPEPPPITTPNSPDDDTPLADSPTSDIALEPEQQLESEVVTIERPTPRPDPYGSVRTQEIKDDGIERIYLPEGSRPKRFIWKESDQTWTTIHRDKDGRFYMIVDDESMPIANARFRTEKERNHAEKIRAETPEYDAASEGLYEVRHDDDGNEEILRPTPSSEAPNGFAVDSEGNISPTTINNQEKLEIDLRATAIVAAQKEWDRVYRREKKSIQEADEAAAKVYDALINRPSPFFTETIDATLEDDEDDVINGEFEDIPQDSFEANHRAAFFEQLGGEALHGAGATNPETSDTRPAAEQATGQPTATPEEEQAFKTSPQEATQFIRDMLIQYPKSGWLKNISPQEMQGVIDKVRDYRDELNKNGVTDKKTQDKRIYRYFRQQLDLNQNPEEWLKQTHGVIWDLMGENMNGSIPI